MPRRQSTQERVSKLDIKRIAKSLFDESDRGCVLVAASLIEDLLELALRTHFRDGDNAVNGVFEGMGILATFSSKIEMAYLLEIVDKAQRDGLNTLRKIRNDAAHLFDDFSLDSDRVKTFVSSRVAILNDEAMESSLVEGDPDTSIRARFVDAILTYVPLLIAVETMAGRRHFDLIRFLKTDTARNQDEVQRANEELQKLQAVLEEQEKEYERLRKIKTSLEEQVSQLESESREDRSDGDDGSS